VTVDRLPKPITLFSESKDLISCPCRCGRDTGASFPMYRGIDSVKACSLLTRDNATLARGRSRVRASKRSTLARRTCPPITITRIPVILHTRIIGCSALPPFLSLSLSLSLSVWFPCCFGAARSARIRLARSAPPQPSSAWQVTRNLFACRRTRPSPLIPLPKLLRRASTRFTYPPFTRCCF
jgi:hypothetical protein